MTNEERRAALDRARELALDFAEQATMSNYDDSYEISRCSRLSEVWTGVALAMKDGDPNHDGVLETTFV